MVYVDELRDHGWVLRGKRTQSCHMAADTLEELHAFARLLGLKRAWYQSKSHPHYDLAPSKRALALRHGAKELTNGEFVSLYKWRKNKWHRRNVTHAG